MHTHGLLLLLLSLEKAFFMGCDALRDKGLTRLEAVERECPNLVKPNASTTNG